MDLRGRSVSPLRRFNLIRSPHRLRNGYKLGTNENQWETYLLLSFLSSRMFKYTWQMENGNRTLQASDYERIYDKDTVFLLQFMLQNYYKINTEVWCINKKVWCFYEVFILLSLFGKTGFAEVFKFLQRNAWVSYIINFATRLFLNLCTCS